MAYSKSRVDKAGKVYAEFRSHPNDSDSELEAATQVIEWWRSEHRKPLSRVAANLRHHAAREGAPVVSQRLKRAPTIGGKLVREPTMKLSRMEDIGGVRAILPDQASAYRVARTLRRNWTITRVRDYVAKPKADGYRAVHLVNRNQGRFIEVQLRTPRQDRWANLAEVFASNFPDLRSGGGPAELAGLLPGLALYFEFLDRGIPPPAPFIDAFRPIMDRTYTFLRRQAHES